MSENTSSGAVAPASSAPAAPAARAAAPAFYYRTDTMLTVGGKTWPRHALIREDADIAALKESGQIVRCTRILASAIEGSAK